MNTVADLSTDTFVPTNAKTAKPCNLAMQQLYLTGKILPVGARLVVRHTFRSDEKRPLEVIYAFGLPRDAALRRFRVTGEKFSVRSELKTVVEAEKAYEEAIEEGHLATLARQYGDGVVNLNLGNIRPGETVTVYLEVIAGVESRDDGFRFRFPFTLAPTYHAQARVIEIEPGEGEIELPEDEFDHVILPRWVDKPESLHGVGFSLSVDMPGGIAEIASPSHPIRILDQGRSNLRVLLAVDNDVPDRDLVLDVRARDGFPQAMTGIDKEGKGRFAAAIPSHKFGEVPREPRQVVFVLDRSGSMEGPPMEQALKAAKACLGALSADDRFAIVAFDTEVSVCSSQLLAGTTQGREKAQRFLETISARGGTELVLGLTEASKLLGDHGGDIFLLTDGQVSGTGPIIQQANSAGIRIHCLGIGSASQDRFLSLLASQTGGTSQMVTPRERVDMAAVKLFASVGRPVASQIRIEIEGLGGADLAPSPPTAVFAGSPLVVFGSTDGHGEGHLKVSWDVAGRRKNLTIPLVIQPDDSGEVLRLLQGAKRIASLDAEYVGSEDGWEADRRERSRTAQLLEHLSREYGLASRCMALVAVVQRVGDKAEDLPETRVVPVGMPQDTAFSAYFAGHFAPADACLCPAPEAFFAVRPCPVEASGLRPRVAHDRDRYLIQHNTAEDVLLELAARIQPDGGLPGKENEDRVIATLVAVLLYVAEGHTTQEGTFMPHVRRLLSYLAGADISAFNEEQRRQIATVLDNLNQGNVIKGQWLSLARSYLNEGKVRNRQFWKEIRNARLPEQGT